MSSFRVLAIVFVKRYCSGGHLVYRKKVLGLAAKAPDEKDMDGDLGSVVQIQLIQDAADVVLDGRVREAEIGGDLLV